MKRKWPYPDNAYHQAHDEFRERELDKAVLFIQLLVKDGIPLEPWHK